MYETGLILVFVLGGIVRMGEHLLVFWLIPNGLSLDIHGVRCRHWFPMQVLQGWGLLIETHVILVRWVFVFRYNGQSGSIIAVLMYG